MNKVIDLSLLNKPLDAINNERYNAYFESYLSNNINTRISLNGLWKFIYLDKFHSEIDNKYLDKDYDIKDLKEIKLPSHIELYNINNSIISFTTKHKMFGCFHLSKHVLLVIPFIICHNIR